MEDRKGAKIAWMHRNIQCDQPSSRPQGICNNKVCFVFFLIIDKFSRNGDEFFGSVFTIFFFQKRGKYDYFVLK